MFARSNKEAGAVPGPGPDYAILDAAVDSIDPVAESAVDLAPLLASSRASISISTSNRISIVGRSRCKFIVKLLS